MEKNELQEAVPAEELKEEALPEEPAAKKPAKKAREVKLAAKVIAGCKLLNVRKEPSLNAAIVGVLREGDELLVSKNGSTDDFYKVTCGDLHGYCKKDFVEVAEAPKSEDKEA